MKSKNIYVNLPVKNLQASIKFFERIGFSFNSDFSDETGACLVIGDNIFAMLLTEKKFTGFTNLPITDAHKSTEVLIAIDQPSKEAVNDMVEKAVQAGGKIYSAPQDHGWMYQKSFADPDGHKWEVFWMNSN